MKEKNSDNNACFVCGKDNKKGLGFDFTYNKVTEEAESNIKFAENFQGWHGIVHGGLIGTVLDEIQIKAASYKNFRCVTAELNIKYKRPVKTLFQYFTRGKVIKVTDKIIYTEGFIEDRDSNIYAKGTAKLFII